MALSTGRQRGEGLVYTRLPTGGDHHAGPLPRRRLRGGETDAGAAAQQHDALPIQRHATLFVL